MIRINLLYSSVERETTAKGAVRPTRRHWSKLELSAVVIAALLVMALAGEYLASEWSLSTAKERLAEQERTGVELTSVLKEQKELEQTVKGIEARIDAIKRLRAGQSGPSAVLDAIRERILNNPAISLESVTQKGTDLEIKGESSDESAVTQFGRSLEFSSGLFANLSIETQRREAQFQKTSMNVADAPKQEIVVFTIKCAYVPARNALLPGTPQPPSTQPTPVNTARVTVPVPPVVNN